MKDSEWQRTRISLENSSKSHGAEEKINLKTWNFFDLLTQFLGLFLKFTFLYNRGKKNATKLIITENKHFYHELPPCFDGLRILHLTDLHLDERPEMASLVADKIKDLEFDLAVFTGDYTTYGLQTEQAKKSFHLCMKTILDVVNSKDGTYCILGNHDSHLMYDHLSKHKVTILINDLISIKRGTEYINILGTDDVHYFWTQKAEKVLNLAKEHFTIALVHSPELYKSAAENQVNLYLCGHTHGGQICFPGGKAIISHLNTGKKFISGAWKFKKMIGYTSNGIGSSVIPIRFFCPPEIAIHTLLCIGPSRTI